MAAKKRAAPAWIGLAARILLGGLLFYAGFSKLSDIPKFADEVGNYKIPELVPSLHGTLVYLMRLVAVTLPWNEVVLGLLLIIGIWTRAAAIVSMILFAIFAMAVSSAIVRKLNISCGCFNHNDAAKVGLMTLAIDGVGLGLSLLVIVKSSLAKAAR